MKATMLMRAGVLGLVLGASVLPVQAQSMQFQFGFGTDGFGFRRPLVCIELTDRQIRNAVRDQGYSNISLNVADNRRIQVRATRGGWVYLLRVSTCTGTILYRERLRRS
ncbi:MULTISPECIES: hypothetical protein [unclassified Devosia]|jgi:hypothetical protein|uniref:hypothetical protein n=1 Tax=unclassified Devosia TaxID=196773 RepID=UPI000868A7A0|nr:MULTISPECIES: hypothetical protein [unclassified Devosia]MBN9361673.1 hypothetical protein [Devosia sp.]ODS81703.1 MAG: hypothetical protein ABS47_24035 [Devosia sp. SCN 66-27]OJX26713.1 MAG: hypothetical protein BGO83_22930 [Devosia sp. 66-14]